MKQTLNIIGNVIGLVMIIDAIGFVAWAMSGQLPVDGFYVGAITTNIIKLFI